MQSNEIEDLDREIKTSLIDDIIKALPLFTWALKLIFPKSKVAEIIRQFIIKFVDNRDVANARKSEQVSN